jgi:hypothetical protein
MNTNENKNLLLCCLLLLGSFATITAQDGRFKGGLVVGLNISQINGDDYAGFDKIGLQAGVRGVAVLTNKMELGLELLYSQRGSQVPDPAIPQERNGEPCFDCIELTYVEVPVTFNYLDWAAKGGENNTEFHRIHAFGGLSYGRLLNSYVDFQDIVPIQNEFKKNDLSITLGATFYLTPHLGLSLRYTKSIFPLYKDTVVPIRKPLFGFLYNFQTVYMF